MSQPFKLFRLQQVDTQIDRSRQRLNEIETALSQDESMRQAQHQFDQADQNLKACRKALQQAEEAMRQQMIKIETTEAALYGGRVRNPKELQDLQNEAAALKRFRQTLEDRQLEAMLALEEAEAAATQSASQLEQIRQQFSRQHASLNEEQDHLRQDLAHQEAERQATASTIPAEDMLIYDRLRKTRRGVAVAKVENRACAACGSVLNAALLQASRSPNQLTRCDACGRILYAG